MDVYRPYSRQMQHVSCNRKGMRYTACNDNKPWAYGSWERIHVPMKHGHNWIIGGTHLPLKQTYPVCCRMICYVAVKQVVQSGNRRRPMHRLNMAIHSPCYISQLLFVYSTYYIEAVYPELENKSVWLVQYSAHWENATALILGCRLTKGAQSPFKVQQCQIT